MWLQGNGFVIFDYIVTIGKFWHNLTHPLEKWTDLPVTLSFYYGLVKNVIYF